MCRVRLFPPSECSISSTSRFPGTFWALLLSSQCAQIHSCPFRRVSFKTNFNIPSAVWRCQPPDQPSPIWLLQAFVTLLSHTVETKSHQPSPTLILNHHQDLKTFSYIWWNNLNRLSYHSKARFCQASVSLTLKMEIKSACPGYIPEDWSVRTSQSLVHTRCCIDFSSSAFLFFQFILIIDSIQSTKNLGSIMSLPSLQPVVTCPWTRKTTKFLHSQSHPNLHFNRHILTTKNEPSAPTLRMTCPA